MSYVYSQLMLNSRYGVGNNQSGIHVSGMKVDLHELHTSVRRVCASGSITLFAIAMTRRFRIPQQAR